MLVGRLHMAREDAEKLMHRQQKLRDHFTKIFLDQDDHTPALYDLLFNNDRCTTDTMARTIAGYIEIWLDQGESDKSI
jgi:hypothetical protein